MSEEKNQLIKVTETVINGETVQTVDARELWQGLKVGRDFSNWIKDRIEKYGFEEEKDFSPNLAKTSPEGGRPAIDYTLSLDMAKELAMVENNEQGRKVRRYFIEVEKQFRQVVLPVMPKFSADDMDRTLFYQKRSVIKITSLADVLGVDVDLLRRAALLMKKNGVIQEGIHCFTVKDNDLLRLRLEAPSRGLGFLPKMGSYIILWTEVGAQLLASIAGRTSRFLGLTEYFHQPPCPVLAGETSDIGHLVSAVTKLTEVFSTYLQQQGASAARPLSRGLPATM